MGALAAASHCALRRGRVGMRVVVPIARLDRPTIRALGYARSIAAHVSVVHITNDDAGAERIRRSWRRLDPGPAMDLVVVRSRCDAAQALGTHLGPPGVATPLPKHSTGGREKSA